MQRPVLRTADEIQNWCVRHVADLLGESAAKIDPTADFDTLGVDSAMAVSMLLDLEEQLGNMPIPPDMLFEHGTIADVSVHLAREVARVHPEPRVEVTR